MSAGETTGTVRLSRIAKRLLVTGVVAGAVMGALFGVALLLPDTTPAGLPGYFATGVIVGGFVGLLVGIVLQLVNLGLVAILRRSPLTTQRRAVTVMTLAAALSLAVVLTYGADLTTALGTVLIVALVAATAIGAALIAWRLAPWCLGARPTLLAR